MEVRNREIKFRAWDVESNRWLAAVPRLKILLDEGDAAVSHHDIDEEASLYFFPQNPLGPTHDNRIIYTQWTGLLDRKGKEIYEGDIVKYSLKEKDYIEQIVFQDFCFKMVDSNGSSIPLGEFLGSICVVVGNIFEGCD